MHEGSGTKKITRHNLLLLSTMHQYSLEKRIFPYKIWNRLNNLVIGKKTKI